MKSISDGKGPDKAVIWDLCASCGRKALEVQEAIKKEGQCSGEPSSD